MDVNPKFGSNSEISARAVPLRFFEISHQVQNIIKDDKNKP